MLKNRYFEKKYPTFLYTQKKNMCLSISLPQEDSFSKVKKSYINSAYCRICDDYGVNADETWMYGG